MDQDETWHGCRPWPRPHCVRWRPSAPLHPWTSKRYTNYIIIIIIKKGHSNPQFLVHVCCDQTAGWIKMLLGTEVGLGPGDIVLDGDPAPPQKKRRGTAHQIFSPCLLRPNGRPSQLLLSTCRLWFTKNRKKSADFLRLLKIKWVQITRHCVVSSPKCKI